jgi:CRP/FNR family transcriptional regulator, cyclic AMP receptor protein
MPFAAAGFSPSERRPLLDLDPGLAELLPPDHRPPAARSLYVDVRQLSRGPLDLARLHAASPTNIGLLLVDGMVSREVILGDTVSAELLGPGDLIRPWDLAAGGEMLETRVRWSVVSEHADTALLDRRFAAELSSHPEINVALIDRLNARAARVATTQAISQLQRVDRRLTALFTHLSERWGRMTADGVVLPLRLSHRMLGNPAVPEGLESVAIGAASCDFSAGP